MSHRNLLLKALENYYTDYEGEKPFIAQTIEFIKNNPNCFERTNLNGHICGSIWIISPDGKKALLTHHKKLNRWFQLGGHSDGDGDTWNVALREAQEESGIEGLSFITRDIFDIDIHPIPENKKKNEPAHLHYDIRFLLQAPTEDFIISDESNDLKWVSSEELDKMYARGEIGSAMHRMHNNWISR